MLIFNCSVALVVIAASLIIRLRTWRVRWETSATVGLALLGAGWLLMTPLSTVTIGHGAYRMTGIMHIDDFLGNVTWLGAALCFLYYTLERLAAEHEIGPIITTWATPLVVIVPMMLGSLVMSGEMQDHEGIELTDIHADLQVCIYRAMWHGGMLYLCLLSIYVLRIVLRDTDKRSHVVATLFLWANAIAVLKIAVRIVAFWPQYSGLAPVFQGLAAASASLVAGALAYSWLVKVRPYAKLLRGLRRPNTIVLEVLPPPARPEPPQPQRTLDPPETEPGPTAAAR
ncbi:membrane protein [Mycobacterium Phage Nergal]|nr:membrane protein [Mycobacterium Phage Nergal]